MDIRSFPWHALSCVQLKRKSITWRHDRASNLLCQFARSNDCLAHHSTKDLAHVLPDGDIYMAHRTVMYDVSGVNPHSPSYVNKSPGYAVDARVTSKASKYAELARQHGCDFVPFVLDSYGSLSRSAKQLVRDIQSESLTTLTPSSPFRISHSAFLHQLSSSWQVDNAKIFVQWMTLTRQHVTRNVLRPQMLRVVTQPTPALTAPSVAPST